MDDGYVAARIHRRAKALHREVGQRGDEMCSNLVEGILNEVLPKATHDTSSSVSGIMLIAFAAAAAAAVIIDWTRATTQTQIRCIGVQRNSGRVFLAMSTRLWQQP